MHVGDRSHWQHLWLGKLHDTLVAEGLDPETHIDKGGTKDEFDRVQFTIISTSALLLLLKDLVDSSAHRTVADVKARSIQFLVDTAKSLDFFRMYRPDIAAECETDTYKFTVALNGVLRGWAQVMRDAGQDFITFWTDLQDDEQLGF